jgi:hypothetical protein
VTERSSSLFTRIKMDCMSNNIGIENHIANPIGVNTFNHVYGKSGYFFFAEGVKQKEPGILPAVNDLSGLAVTWSYW